MERVDWQRFDYSQLDNVPVLERKVGNPAGTKHRPDYLPFIATFDTETTTIEIKKRKHAFVYVWMFYLPHIDTMITGRTIEEYIVFAEILSGHLQGNLLVYVHNLSFNPIPETLMLSWDNIEPFIVAVWKAINDNRK